MESQEELKDQAIAYYNNNKVPMRMQEVLNAMFHVQPEDVNGYVSKYFEDLSMAPTISKAVAIRSLDNKGCCSILTKLYCKVRNNEKLVGESRVCIDSELVDSCKDEDKDTEDGRTAEVDDAINLINNEIQNILISKTPSHQHALDEEVYSFVETRRIALLEKNEDRQAEEATPQPAIDDNKKGSKKSGKGSGKKKNTQIAIVPDKVKEVLYPGSSSVTALSQAFCTASAVLAGTSVFDHLIQSSGGDDYSICLPLPVITILQSGKAALGKSNCVKEFMVVPSPSMKFSEAIPAVIKLHGALMKLLCAKGGVTAKNVNDFGALCPALDKPEQGLDMIIEALSQQGLEMGKDFFFILNSSAHDYFDYEKGKYEVITGALKASEDMADFWTDLCNRYPSIIGIIDPVRPEEAASWNKLCSEISDRCLIITEKGYDRPGLLKNQTLDFHQFATSGLVMRLTGCNTVTHITECAKKMIDCGNTVMLAGGENESNSTLLVDVAIASKARFIKLGAPARGERIAKFNRLLELEEELGERRTQWGTLEFPVIPPKLPTPSPTDENETSTES